MLNSLNISSKARLAMLRESMTRLQDTAWGQGPTISPDERVKDGVDLSPEARECLCGQPETRRPDAIHLPKMREPGTNCDGPKKPIVDPGYSFPRIPKPNFPPVPTDRIKH